MGSALASLATRRKMYRTSASCLVSPILCNWKVFVTVALLSLIFYALQYQLETELESRTGLPRAGWHVHLTSTDSGLSL